MHKLNQIVEVAQREQELTEEMQVSIKQIKKYAFFISNIEKREEVFEDEIHRYSVEIQKERFKIKQKAEELSRLVNNSIKI